MANQPVIIKSNKYGLIVILDAELSMEKLKEEVAEKFRSSAKFFGEAQMAVCFQGRGLSLEEEMELVETISGNCQIRIVSIIDENEELEAQMQRALEEKEKKPADLMNLQDGRFYKGTLRSGQVLESETSVIILGDVNPGARVISKGNVIVLGTLKGNIFVGAAGNEAAFVAALSMDPMQIRIGDVIARCSDGTSVKKKKKVDNTPKIAYVEDGNIYIEPITKEVLNDIRL
ncbi:MAG: septum site-determining protein MinC [Lachnospiraceae bacterium]|jgi:septum site-determining protein MinC|uniref:Probable septum site-determining protein MinC n=1 Tax=Thomasclavelia cocleata TaxID=69824 RepID=A0A829ZCU3_9FIRM|nr:septum site-determining protein MinC [Thomasclavelia cocleata]MCI8862287.1 septum site-determining protein MinC [Lachnospiraceae bacterium]MCI9306997.1 septum site-determining protein MinC [Lachnospiraceae bacterium]GFI41208.1 septum site-determining protein MinC [Thomasclavelia cocleata]